jgi:hypothetical protein
LLGKFVETFFHINADLQYAPKRIQVLWDHGMDDCDGANQDLTPILHMHATASSLTYEFVPEI